MNVGEDILLILPSNSEPSGVSYLGHFYLTSSKGSLAWNLVACLCYGGLYNNTWFSLYRCHQIVLEIKSNCLYTVHGPGFNNFWVSCCSVYHESAWVTGLHSSWVKGHGSHW